MNWKNLKYRRKSYDIFIILLCLTSIFKLRTLHDVSAISCMQKSRYSKIAIWDKHIFLLLSTYGTNAIPLECLVLWRYCQQCLLMQWLWFTSQKGVSKIAYTEISYKMRFKTSLKYKLNIPKLQCCFGKLLGFGLSPQRFLKSCLSFKNKQRIDLSLYPKPFKLMVYI